MKQQIKTALRAFFGFDRRGETLFIDARKLGMMIDRVHRELTEDDGVPFYEKMTELTAKLYEQFAEARHLEATIRKNPEGLGYGEVK